jgi:hypothetical protein
LELVDQNNSIRELSKITKYQLGFFLLWPFGMVVLSLKNFRSSSSKIIFWLFCIYFGFVFIYDQPFHGSADSARYAANLIELYNNPISFRDLISSFYNPNEGYADIYQLLTTWMISNFTNEPRILFTLFAGVFGFFYTQNLWMVFNFINKNSKGILLLFVLCFALVNPIWEINAVRMWTAAQIFLYGNLRYFLFNSRKGLWWSASAILVHFSFVFPVAVMLIWLFLPKNTVLFFAFYVVTFFINEIDINIFRNMIDWLPEVFQNKAGSYTSDAAMERLSWGTYGYSWHVVFARSSMRILTFIWVIAMFIRRNQWTDFLTEYYHLFSFALVFGGFANLSTSVLSGSRFFTVSEGLFFALFVSILGQQNIDLRLKFLKIITIPFLAFIIFFRIRLGLGFAGILTFIGNPLIALFMPDQTPIIDFIKQLIQ